jgi:hypothetical protein
MKNLIYTSVLFLFAASLFAQTSLTFRNNALRPGDECSSREIQFVEPGGDGPNQIWDFSGIRFTGPETAMTVLAGDGLKSAPAGNSDIMLSENGYDYFLKSDAVGLVERGYVNSGKMINLEYTDPAVKMKYPFSYGDSFRDPFTAVAYVGENNRVDFTGDITVTADAYGSLILPDRVIRNVLRVKTVKKGVQTGQCGSTEVSIVRYLWYAGGLRYPVMNAGITETRYSSGAPVITRNAFVTVQQPVENGLAAGTDDRGKTVGNEDVSVIIFPNPFTEKLTYNYFLRKQLPVTIELYDMSGKVSLRITRNQVQPEGLHTGEVDATLLGLTPGIYYLRFTFDKQVVVTKVVRV